MTDDHDSLTDDEEFRRLVERSSLGTTGARALRQRTAPERLGAVHAAVDRVWSVRDAVLKWLYLKAMVETDRHPRLHADDIAKTVDWHDSPLGTSEVEQASSWLLGQGFLNGSESWGHGVGRPTITAKGEALVDAGRSVRGGEEQAQPQDVYISHSTNVAVGSPGAQQSNLVSVQLEKANVVAAALEDAARAPDVSPEVAAEAERAAAEIRSEASRQEPDVGRLKALLFSAMTGIAATFGQTTGTDLAHLASQALQTL
jgi:hypothetical protein